MCLEAGFKPTTEKQSSGYGWKVFRLKDDKIQSLYGAKQNNMTFNKWLKEQYYRVKDISFDSNEFIKCPIPDEGFGFHIFLKKKDAFNYADHRLHTTGFVKKVQYKRGTYKGTTQSLNFNNISLSHVSTIVAKEIKILEN